MTSMVPRLSQAKSSVTFRTSDLWLASDLTALTTAVEVIYGVYLSFLVLPEFELWLPPTHPESIQSRRRAYDEQKLIAMLSQGWFGPAAQVIGRVMQAGVLGTRFVSADEMYSYPPPTEYDPIKFLYLLRSSIYDVLAGTSLTVGNISMQSPGIISFKGLGEPLRQVRELIKDIWYRNRQEKERGDFELRAIQIKLREIESAASIRGPADGVDRAVLLIANAVEVVRALEDGRKLEGVAESLDREVVQ